EATKSAEWAPVMLPLVHLARELKAAVVIGTHAKKSEDGGYRDSSAIAGWVDMILEVRVDTTNPARRNVTALGRWPAPNFAVELVGDGYTLLAGGELSLDAKILAYVQQHPKASGAQVRGAIGGRGTDVDLTIGRLLGSGAIRDLSATPNRHAYVVAEGTPARASDGEEDNGLPF